MSRYNSWREGKESCSNDYKSGPTPSLAARMSGPVCNIHVRVMSSPSVCWSEYECLALNEQTHSQTTPCFAVLKTVAGLRGRCISTYN